jgi:hypothetical protein
MIFRAVTMGREIRITSNVGEQVATVITAIIILILTAKGKDRACYICYAAWIGYFVFDQLFELPGMLTDTTDLIFKPTFEIVVGDFAVIFRLLSMISILAIGVLLVEYMNDGTIYNRAFNTLCIITIVMILASVGIALYDVTTLNESRIWLDIFNNLYRMTMVFMFTFFAYDSAKHQLKKVNFSK